MIATGVMVSMVVMEGKGVMVGMGGMVGMEGMAVMAEAMITILATVETNTEDPPARVSRPVQATVVAGEGEATPPARPVLLLLHMGEWEVNS
jgi:hypothetical protein